MGYLHIDNLYKNKEIMNFKECYALEKIHGTSAHIKWDYETKEIKYFSGGTKHDTFVKIFDHAHLKTIFHQSFLNTITIYGESYGGAEQGMNETYGKEPKFVAFDVKIGDNWLSVPDAEEVVKKFELDFVDYHKITTDLNSINAERDFPSTQGIRNGMGQHKREGIVLRPLIELSKNNGSRIICKHKNDEFRETKTPRIVSDEELKVLEDAKKIADEWVTLERLKHVLDKIPKPHDITKTGIVIKAMVEDVFREGEGEIIKGKEVAKVIGSQTAIMYKQLVSGVNGRN